MSRRRLLQGVAAVNLSLIVPGRGLASFGPSPPPLTKAIWLDAAAPAFTEGMTFGVPWPRGAVSARATFAMEDLPVQSWPIAYWPDGSLKWSAHAVAAADAPRGAYALTMGKPAAPAAPVRIERSARVLTVSTGDAVWTLPTSGTALITQATRGGRKVMGAVTLGLLTQNAYSLEENSEVRQTSFEGQVEDAVVEQHGPVRAAIRLTGRYSGGGRQWLPFTVRLYFHAGAESVRIVHSFIYDGDETKDIISGMCLKAMAPMRDALENRHVRFSGQDGGVWGEAVRSITGLRRSSGRELEAAQVAGKFVDAAKLPGKFPQELKWVPPWDAFTLSQPAPDGYTITKRTAPGQGWIASAAERRASGLGYVGGVSGGIALGMKDFWQRYPSRIDVRGATQDEASLTMWMWAPDAPAMDLRPYRADMGMNTYEKQNEGLDITYEDFEPGWNKPYGIARTTEFILWALPATPERDRFAGMAHQVSAAPRLTISPERLHAAGVFGDWSLVDRSTPTRKAIEARMDYQLDYYLQQIEANRWYGFWNYGNVMASYDPARHVWKYDMGGSAWDNSELQSDMMFWYAYLRSGRPDIYRLAEAMTRQTGEVAVLHLGPYKGFGTRHGVQPFSDSSKQPRVSNAAFRRIYYYLTADERTGDLMRELVDSDQTLKNVFIERKVASEGGSGHGVREKIPGTVDCSFGTSWGSFVAAWLTEWERTGDKKWRDRIVNGMNSIAKLKNGWFCGGAPYDLATGRFVGRGDQINMSHLNGVFGVMEMHQELMPLLNVPAYKKVWLDYCRYYNAPTEEITAFLGVNPGGRGLTEAHSRYTAYAARELKDVRLADRAWKEFFGPRGVPRSQTQRVAGSAVLHPVDEDPRISTNGVSQWGLAAIQNIALIGDTLDTLGAKYAASRAPG
ncbi:Tat pathway signal sequence domain protein [Sphingomonas sp.]|jgi:hypothetical protein|uniref:exo-rhamnogalacturonan lyase family protein n=1 Tax=Sphingomonas sp. TaxID=28214 RepID=UPI002EDAE673